MSRANLGRFARTVERDLRRTRRLLEDGPDRSEFHAQFGKLLGEALEAGLFEDGGQAEAEALLEKMGGGYVPDSPPSIDEGSNPDAEEDTYTLTGYVHDSEPSIYGV